MFYNTLQPLGLMLFACLFAAFPFLKRERRDWWWFLTPLAGLVAVSFEPKKNSWYILELLVFLPLVAAMALAEWRRRVRPKTAALLTGLWCLLLGLVYLGTFTNFAADRQNVTRQYMERAYPISQAIDRDRRQQGRRNQVRNFAQLFPRLFPGRQTVRLGLVVDAFEGRSTVLYYLRGQRLPLEIFFAAIPDKHGQLRMGDVVLFIPSANRAFQDTVATLDHPAEFHRRYVEPLYNGIPDYAKPPQAPTVAATEQLIRIWRQSPVVDLPGGWRLFYSTNRAPAI